MDVASWLRSLGLEQYEATFRDNAIDDSVLPDLTDQDLEKLGVLLGHRRKLLRAIANIEATAQTAPSEVGAIAVVDVSPRDTAERRQVTVIFSDLVGSTALSARMDPEDLRPRCPPFTLRHQIRGRDCWPGLYTVETPVLSFYTSANKKNKNAPAGLGLEFASMW